MGPVVPLLVLAGLGASPEVEGIHRLEVVGGQAEVVLDSDGPARRYLLLLGALGSCREKCRVRVACAPTVAAAGVAWRPVVRRQPAESDFRALLSPAAREAEPTAGPSWKTRRGSKSAASGASAAPVRTRHFHLFLGGTDLEDPRQYETIAAELIVHGRYVQAYADRRDLDLPHLAAAATDALEAFETTIRPWVEQNLGEVEDVDRDGRFTLFFSRRLRKLQGTGPALDGFVRGGDFLRDLGPPLGNRCDMAYLNAELRAGPRLRTVLAHEYVHAAVFCARVLARRDGGSRRDEESWLHEALAHVVERRLGYSWCNLDHRVSAYLQRPEAYPLVVPDAYAAGLWRSPGVRGAGFLFLQGRTRGRDEVLSRLVRTHLRGQANLAAACGENFEEGFRNFAVDLATGAWHVEGTTTRFGKGEGPRRLWCGPRTVPLAMKGGEAAIEIVGTGVGVVELRDAGTGRTRLRLAVEGGAGVQATLLRLPEDLPRLEVEADVKADGLRIRWEVVHGPLTLTAASWEGMQQGHGTSAEGEVRTAEETGFARWFTERTGRPGRKEEGFMPLPPGAAAVPLVVQLVGRDDRGRLVAGRAETAGSGIEGGKGGRDGAAAVRRGDPR